MWADMHVMTFTRVLFLGQGHVLSMYLGGSWGVTQSTPCQHQPRPVERAECRSLSKAAARKDYQGLAKHAKVTADVTFEGRSQ